MQRLTRTLAMAASIALAGVLAGCGDDVSIEPEPGITLTPPSATLAVGQTAQFSATVVGLANKTVTWSSSSANATVDNTGKVTAVSAGSATIIAATSDPNVKASAVVTITPVNKGVTKVDISPNADILAPGQTRQLVANVTRDPGVAGTVTWSSNATAVATVSTTGVVTAVAPGSAQITAASTVDPTVTGFAAITVRPPAPATISIQKVTVTGNTAATVNFTNVQGGIDVTLNVDPGDQIIQRVEVLLDNNVVCTQQFSASESEALSLAAVFDEVQAVDVVCQINTAEFAADNGAVKYTNGQRALSARAVIQGGTQTATPSVQLTFNNQNGIVVTVTNDNGTDPASAVNAGTGLAWTGGSATIKVVGVSYTPSVGVASANLTLFGKARTIALTNNVGSVTYAEGTTWSATNTGLGNYLSPSGGETAAGASAVLTNGANLVSTNPIILNFVNAPTGNATIPVLQTIRHDNTAPGQASANGIVQQGIAIGQMPVWVNATTAFSAGNVGIPTTANLNLGETTAGPVTSGVDNVTVTVYQGAVGTLAGYNPGGLTAIAGSPAGTCDLTGLTAITVGSNLAETIVSGSYQARVEIKDALGNRVCYDLNPVNAANPTANGSFGADFTAPTGTLTGPAANSAFIALPPNYSVAATDNASGFSATPLNVIVTRTNAQTANSCVIGSGTGCTTPAARALAFDATNGVAAPTNEGYYTTTITLVDQAGNSTVLTTARVFLLDDPAQIAPGSTTDIGFTGGISLPSVIAGATTNSFTATPVEDLDIASVFGVVTYANGLIQYPSQALGEYNTPLQRAGTAINYGATNWIRCLNVAGDFVSTNTQPTSITLTAVDQANNQGSLTSGAFGANAQACGTVGDLGVGFAINFFGNSVATGPTLNYGTGKTQVDIDGASLAAASSETVTITVIADVPLNTSANPFQRVELFYQQGGTWRSIGNASATLAQTQTNRTWTYTFTWNPDAAVTPGAVNVVAIGVDSQGDAVMSNTVAVTVVP